MSLLPNLKERCTVCGEQAVYVSYPSSLLPQKGWCLSCGAKGRVIIKSSPPTYHKVEGMWESGWREEGSSWAEINLRPVVSDCREEILGRCIFLEDGKCTAAKPSDRAYAAMKYECKAWGYKPCTRHHGMRPPCLAFLKGACMDEPCPVVNCNVGTRQCSFSRKGRCQAPPKEKREPGLLTKAKCEEERESPTMSMGH